jgi:hypothetical protein
VSAYRVSRFFESDERRALETGVRRARGRRLAAHGAVLALAAFAGGCSSCEDTADAWRTTYISAAQAAEASEAAAGPPPNCDVAARRAERRVAGAADEPVDSDLLEIARLEVERDCYKSAEHSLRARITTQESSGIRLK